MRAKGTGTIKRGGYIEMGGSDKNDKKFLHVMIAEKALGKPLPLKAVIHHVNETSDNKNLVICPNQAYHLMIHQRMRALNAGFPAHYVKCAYCKTFDDPANMYMRKTISQGWHRQCANERKK